MAPGELLDDHPADVVTIAGVLATGIPETRDEQVERRGALAPTEQPHRGYSSSSEEASEASPASSASSSGSPSAGSSPSSSFGLGLGSRSRLGLLELREAARHGDA